MPEPASQRLDQHTAYALIRRLLTEYGLGQWKRYAFALTLAGLTAASTALVAYLTKSSGHPRHCRSFRARSRPPPRALLLGELLELVELRPAHVSFTRFTRIDRNDFLVCNETFQPRRR